MRYVVTSNKSVDQAVADLETAVRENGFGVLHQYDLKQTLAGKGVETCGRGRRAGNRSND